MSFTIRMCWRAVIYVARCRSSTRWSWRPSRPFAVARRPPCTAPCWAPRGRVRRLGPIWAPAAEGRQSQAQVSLPRGIFPASSLASWAKVSSILWCSADVWLFCLTRQIYFFFHLCLSLSLHPVIGVAVRRGQHQLLPTAHRQMPHPRGTHITKTNKY